MRRLFARASLDASPRYNRYLIAPAALAIHLCIGQVYAFSVFNLPLTRTLGITESATGDWSLPELGWIYTLAIVFLGLSAAVGGRWVQSVGPRVSGTASACCWSAGFFLGALGISLHNIWLIYLGYGVVGGCGLGLGYITPVSTLIRWFPDKRGFATGIAIMGFGGGAMLAAPVSQWLMSQFASPTSVGVAETFLVLGAVYLVVMLCGAFAFRLPPPDWKPAGWTPPPATAALLGEGQTPNEAMRTLPFWLLWMVLFLNVTAGIGVLGQASAMCQQMFPESFDKNAAAGYVSLLSFFNLIGRFLWSSASDYLGRKWTYAIFFSLGSVLYAVIPATRMWESPVLFSIATAGIMTMYGGGFATIPAYLSDVFGARHIGAVHGRLLTAWSAAGVAGPVLVNYIHEYQIQAGVANAESYDLTMGLMAGLLVIGFLCNLGVRTPPLIPTLQKTPGDLDRVRPFGQPEAPQTQKS